MHDTSLNHTPRYARRPRPLNPVYQQKHHQRTISLALYISPSCRRTARRVFVSITSVCRGDVSWDKDRCCQFHCHRVPLRIRQKRSANVVQKLSTAKTNSKSLDAWPMPSMWSDETGCLATPLLANCGRDSCRNEVEHYFPDPLRHHSTVPRDLGKLGKSRSPVADTHGFEGREKQQVKEPVRHCRS